MGHENIYDRYDRRTAEALEAIQGILLLIAHHLIGGASPEEVEEAKAEARALKQALRKSRMKLGAAVEAAQPTPEG